MALKIQLAQINSSVGDLQGNGEKIMQAFKQAEKEGCDLVVFCEMAICGYPAQDLWLKHFFIDQVEEKILELMALTQGSKCAMLVGAPIRSVNRSKKDIVHNCAILIENGKVVKTCPKKTLANHGVFDEKRYFEAGTALSYVEFRGMTLAILVCEDLWDAKNLFLMKEQVFDMVISINASPYTLDKGKQRQKVAKKMASSLEKPVVYVNQVGGQDALVFDGSSFVLDKEGKTCLQMQGFQEDAQIVTIAKEGAVQAQSQSVEEMDDAGNHYHACVLGLRDYVRKNGFQKVLLGMSGGIDSALVAVMAVDALGAENVSLYALPSRYNSETSMKDATECAHNIGVNLEVISIENTFSAMLQTLEESQESLLGVVQENMQSRIRGNILMALSNNSGALLLSTGNKSELACGYATLYGDMCGAFNPLKDLYKSEVFQIAKWRNNHVIHDIQAPIPDNIITKEPTAELRENQKDSDSLPEYDILDKILFLLIEEQKSVVQIIELGLDEVLVRKIAKLFYACEYKRQQSCLGPKVSNMSFGVARRYPLTNRFLQ